MTQPFMGNWQLTPGGPTALAGLSHVKAMEGTSPAHHLLIKDRLNTVSHVGTRMGRRQSCCIMTFMV